MDWFLDDGDIKLAHGDVIDVLRQLPTGVAQTCVTSPPYWGLRSYLEDGHADKHAELGLEETPDAYVERLVAVFREVWRVLADSGTCWINLGDSFLPNKQLAGIPWRVAFALQEAGWCLRSDLIWAKCIPNPMPESVTDRPTKSHEYLFLLAKQPRYFMDMDAIREEATAAEHVANHRAPRNGHVIPDRNDGGGTATGGFMPNPAGRNRRSVWTIPTQPFSARALGGDTLRTRSPDCPVHGDRPGRGATALGGGHVTHPDAHTQRTDADPAQAPLVDSAPTDPNHEPATAAGSSGSPLPECSPSATPHSSESHRTGPVPATNPACTPSAETPHHTGDTSASPESGALFDHTPESNIDPDGSDAHPSGQTSSRSADKPGLTGGAYSPPGQAPHGNARGKCSCRIVDHFATFPQALVRPCILAGTSERGECVECGAPWTREVEHGELVGTDRGGNYNGRDIDPMVKRNGGTPGMAYENRTTGWRASCTCNTRRLGHIKATCPQIVIDPFVGSGTTALVARKHGRRCIGIDLSESYLQIAARRLQQLSLLAVDL